MSGTDEFVMPCRDSAERASFIRVLGMEIDGVDDREMVDAMRGLEAALASEPLTYDPFTVEFADSNGLTYREAHERLDKADPDWCEHCALVCTHGVCPYYDHSDDS